MARVLSSALLTLGDAGTPLPTAGVACSTSAITGAKATPFPRRLAEWAEKLG